MAGKLEVTKDGSNGRDRDRTDDLYRVKVILVIYRIDSLCVFLPYLGCFYVVFGS